MTQHLILLLLLPCAISSAAVDRASSSGGDDEASGDGAVDELAESECRARGDELGRGDRREGGRDLVVAGGVDDHEVVGVTGLLGESIQCLLQRFAASAGDENGGDARVHPLGAASKLAALPLGEPAPDAEPLGVLQGVLEAL